MGYGGLWVATGMGYDRFDCIGNITLRVSANNYIKFYLELS